MKQTLRLLFTLLLTLSMGGVCMGQDSETSTNTVTDVLDANSLALSGSQAIFSGIKISNGSQAEYAGVAQKSGTEMRLKWDSSNHNGIYTTKSGGIVTSVTITFSSVGKGSVKIVAKNDAFSVPTSLNFTPAEDYDIKVSDKTETFTYTFEKTEKYKFIGIISENNNAAKIDNISITWQKESSTPSETSESLTTANSGFATHAASYPVNYSNLGLTCYQIALDEDNNKVAYTSYTGVVPANQAVLVQGTANTIYTLTKSEADENSTFKTDLKASDGTIKAADNLYYGFSTKNSVSGFYRVKNDLTIPEGKGYIKLENANEAKFFSFDGGNGTTGIGSIENIEKQIMLDNATIYNLAGQRVSKSYKGVIIVNGKKMVNK